MPSASTITDPLPLKMLHWMDYARPGAPGRFPDIAEFIEKNPRLAGAEGAAQACRRGLGRRIGHGRRRLVQALSAGQRHRQGPRSGDHDELGRSRRRHGGAAGALDRRAISAHSTKGIFSPGTPLRSGPKTMCKRIDRLLWDGQTEAARRMLPLVPARLSLLAEARLALAAQAPKAEALVARVPAQLRSDPGLVFEQLRWRRKKDMTDAAVQILLAQPDDLVRPAAWWAERQAIARRVLAGGNAELAYRLVEQHGLIEGNAFSEAQFLLGLYRAALYEAAGARLRALLAHPDAGRHPVCEGASRVLGRTRGRGARQVRAGGEMVRRRGRPHGDVLRTARRAPARPRCAAASDPGAGSRDAAELAQFNADEVVRAARIFFDLGDASSRQGLPASLGRQRQDSGKVRDAGEPRREQRAHRSGDRGGQDARSKPARR